MVSLLALRALFVIEAERMRFGLQCRTPVDGEM
jgi:hypothetical protein